MLISASYDYRERNIVDIQTLLRALRFLIVNTILAVILLFLAIEEVDWIIFSFGEKKTEEVIDATSWNLKNLFLSLVKI